MASKPALGLSITDSTLEALELGESGGKFFVASYAWLRLPQGVIVDGKVNDAKALAAELVKLMASGRPKKFKGPVVLGLPQQHVFLKVFQIPAFEGKDLDEAITWHVGSLKPVLPAQAYTSYEVMEKGKNGDVKVLLAAVSELIVDGYLAASAMAGIEIAMIESLAVAKARLLDPKKLLGKSVVSVHLYGGILSVSALVNGKLWFSRELVVGEGGEGVVVATVRQVVGFFTERKEEHLAAISEVIYSGDRSGVVMIEKSLTGFEVTVRRAESGVALMPSDAVQDAATAAFAPVLGLAMRGKLAQKGLIDLLPKWPKEKAECKRLKQSLTQILVIMGLVVWLVALGLGGWWWWIGEQQRALISLQRQYQAQFAQDREAELLAWGREFNQVVRVVSLIEEKSVKHSEVLTELAAVMPQDVRVTSFGYKANSQWSMAGVAPTRDDVLELDRQLKESGFFAKAQLYFSSLETGEGVIFRFSGDTYGK